LQTSPLKFQFKMRLSIQCKGLYILTMLQKLELQVKDLSSLWSENQILVMLALQYYNKTQSDQKLQKEFEY
jgi:hypothetical protein